MSTLRSTQPAADGPFLDSVRFRGSICYRDAEEMVRTLIAMSYFCREWHTRLHFIGSQADCDQARTDAATRAPEAAIAVRFTAILPQEKPKCAFRMAVDQAIALDPGAVVWLELPFKPGNQPEAIDRAIRSYQARIEDLAAVDAPILFTACRLGDLPDAIIRTLLASNDLVTNAHFVVAFCRDYLITHFESITKGDPENIETLTSPGRINLRQLLRTANMITLGQMASNIAHELGNPLTIISSSIQYMDHKFGEMGSPMREFTIMALENIVRMNAMIRNMLDFAAVKRPPPMDVNLPRLRNF